ncbi:MAG: hypothetical protein GX977_08465 [Firmicutes bacterium]|nr:hypothetical protein [Bacillota bacterium]
MLERQASAYRIVAGKIAEQEPGAMQDGQIHDIDRVARTIRQVSADLEKRLGVIPRQVAVAAAGRTLKTGIGSATYPISPVEPIDALTVQALEMQAVLRARESLNALDDGETSPYSQGNWASAYIFVAYSPMSYYLDNEPIGSLIGHRGTSIGVDVIVTFLPRVVIDSLSASLRAADLEMASLTLEPIAAIEAAIPTSMRRLSLALVDVGAGTSDIALTKDGMVFAYGMVSVAGDEITEVICQHYLLDFSEGERLKRQFQRKERLRVRNVLGQRLQPRPEEVAELIKPAVDILSTKIAAEILRLAGSAPQAVICIGGGSLTPHFPEALANCLDLPTDRIAVRGREAIPEVEGFQDILSGPDSITPIAIAMKGTAASSSFIPITVNGKSIRLLSVSRPTVKEALLAAGIGLKELKGKPGAALTITVNGEVKVIPGSMGKSAVIRIDDQIATPDTPIESHANLIIEPPEPGQDATPILQEITSLPPPLPIYWGERLVAVPARILRNGKMASPTDRVADRDIIEITPCKRLGDIIEWLQAQGEIIEEITSGDSVNYTLNGQKAVYTRGIYVSVNGVQATDETELANGDILQIEPEAEQLTIGKLHELWAKKLTPDTTHDSISITFNREPLTLTRDTVWKYTRQGRPAAPTEIIQEGDVITITPVIDSGEPRFILSDIFRASDFNTPKHQPGGILQILINEEPAGFTSPIDNGDVVEIGWTTRRS